jgi:hypothetical protein
MSTILKEDDFEVRMLITGHSTDQIICHNNLAYYDKTYNGRIYEIIAIDLPYIAIKEAQPTEDNHNTACYHTIMVDAYFAATGNPTQMVDIRHYKFMKTSPQMAQAILGENFQKTK